MLRAHLPDGPAALAPLREAFRTACPGRDLEWWPAATCAAAAAHGRVLFVQGGSARASVFAPPGVPRTTVTLDPGEPDLARGDLLLLRAGARLALEGGELDLLVVHLGGDLPAELPAILRPDVGERFGDAPGGCAEEDDAYRRILLTWDPAVGPHVLHGLNAHRVRMTDSLTHYHPTEGGFVELYLVQDVRPGAHLITVSDAARLADEAAGRAPRPDRAQLLARVQRTELAVGDLVLVPRGTAHRGLGGVLAQVITVPGFVPGAEIGVDADLRTLGEALGLDAETLPYRAASSHGPLVR